MHLYCDTYHVWAYGANVRSTQAIFISKANVTEDHTKLVRRIKTGSRYSNHSLYSTIMIDNYTHRAGNTKGKTESNTPRRPAPFNWGQSTTGKRSIFDMLYICTWVGINRCGVSCIWWLTCYQRIKANHRKKKIMSGFQLTPVRR